VWRNAPQVHFSDMKTALLIADLEGVAGVDDAADLAFGGAGHAAACAAMSEEVAVVCETLLANGYGQVRVSDSHRSGSGHPKLDPLALPKGTSLHWDDDAYAAALFEGASAVACVGMHAGGRTHGFGAHTVQAHAAWRCGFKLVNESELALGLAHEHGVPVLFVSGDQVLAQALHGRAPFVLTKRALSVRTAKSFPSEMVRLSLARAASAEPVRALPPPRGPIAVELKTGGQVAFGRGDSFGARYRAALAISEAALAELEGKVEGTPGTVAFAQSAAALLAQPWA
jgi:D-amino peptidase